MFRPYFNPIEKRYINATKFAYDALYKAQGFIPVGSAEDVIHIHDDLHIPAESTAAVGFSANAADTAETDTVDEGRRSREDNGAVVRVGKRGNRKSA